VRVESFLSARSHSVVPATCNNTSTVCLVSGGRLARFKHQSAKLLGVVVWLRGTGASRFCKNLLVYRDIREFESILSPAPLLPCSPAPLLVGYICTIGMLPRGTASARKPETPRNRDSAMSLSVCNAIALLRQNFCFRCQ
jgi:hypothetical protein